MTRSLVTWSLLIGTLLVAHAASGQVEPTSKQPSADDPNGRPHRLTIELTTLRLLHEKEIINDAEFDSAMRDVGRFQRQPRR